MVWKGVRFGMMLQLAIGPVFFLVLTASALYGCLAGIAVMAAAALVDAVFIAISAGGHCGADKKTGNTTPDQTVWVCGFDAFWIIYDGDGNGGTGTADYLFRYRLWGFFYDGSYTDTI